MPRQVIYRAQTPLDPQTVLQDDKAPILTLNPDYLDCHSDTDPAGDLGKNTALFLPPSSSHRFYILILQTSHLFLSFFIELIPIFPMNNMMYWH